MKLRYLVFACSLLIIAKGAGGPATGQQPAAGDLAKGLHHGFTEVSGWVTKAADLVPADKDLVSPGGVGAHLRPADCPHRGRVQLLLRDRRRPEGAVV